MSTFPPVWQETLKARRASFRGVPFELDEHELSSGRRLAVHEYPQRDKPYAEDMGRKARSIKIRGFVAGSDYMPDRDALLAELERPGPGTLVHPYLGQLQCSVDAVQVTESTEKGGAAFFSITFIESGDATFPNATANTVQAVTLSADLSEFAIYKQFTGDFDLTLEGEFAYVAAAAQADIKAYLDIASQALNLVFPTPVKIDVGLLLLANAIGNGSFLSKQIADLMVPAIRVFNDLTRAINFERPAVPSTLTASRRAQARNTTALVGLVRRMATVEYVRRAILEQPESNAELIATRRRVVAAIDKQITGAARAFEDDSFTAMRALRRDYITHVTRNAIVARRSFTYTTPARVGALAASYDIYGEIRDEELILRNRLGHPGRIPANVVLDCLTVNRDGNRN